MFARENLTYEAVALPDRHQLTDAEMQDAARDFYAVMRKRHSVRDFFNRTVDWAVIEDCVRAAASAPSGANHQPWHFVAISDADTKQRIREAAKKKSAASTPARPAMSG